jgi:hypothetical protein
MTRLLLLALVAIACRPSRTERADARQRAASATLAAYADGTRRAFQRLPACPAVDRYPAAQASSSPLPLPPSFAQDSGARFAHGGSRYRSADTVVEVAYGHWGLASFTGQYDGSAPFPAGCVARVGGRIYMMTEAHDSAGFRAAAVEVSDTSAAYGNIYFGASAPRSVRDWLLSLLAVRTPAG